MRFTNKKRCPKCKQVSFFDFKICPQCGKKYRNLRNHWKKNRHN